MRISDWSSDVCSSDLKTRRLPLRYTRSRHRLAVVPSTENMGNSRQRHHRGGFLPSCQQDPHPDRPDREFRSRQDRLALDAVAHPARSEEHTSELQSLMRISYAVFCLKKTHRTYNRRLST